MSVDFWWERKDPWWKRLWIKFRYLEIKTNRRAWKRLRYSAWIRHTSGAWVFGPQLECSLETIYNPLGFRLNLFAGLHCIGFYVAYSKDWDAREEPEANHE